MRPFFLSVATVVTISIAVACGRAVSVGSTASAAPPLPASSVSVAERITSSSRHGEWAMIRTPEGDSIRAWVVYPERSNKAPVVVVIHEIFGLSTWIRGVADQLAANGYIAIAPDLITGKVSLVGDTVSGQAASAAIRSLNPGDVQRQIEAVARHAMALPAAQPRYGIVGFCWGGSTSFAHAVRSPQGLRAAVVYYGSSPDTASLASVQVPVLGLYGGDDARVNATVPRTDTIMRRLGKTYDVHFFDGAGHGFLRQQEGREANRVATEKAWPLTIDFFRRHLGA